MSDDPKSGIGTDNLEQADLESWNLQSSWILLAGLLTTGGILIVVLIFLGYICFPLCNEKERRNRRSAKFNYISALSPITPANASRENEFFGSVL